MRKAVAVIALLMIAVNVPAAAQLTPEAARQVVTKVEPAVVSVKVNVEMTMAYEGRQGEKQEMENESTGVVVDPKGLTCVSLTAMDPSSFYQDMYEGLGEEGSSFNVKADIKDIKIRFPDGTEVTGEVAIRDRDLDLAFIKPKTPLTAPVAAVDLSASADADIMDQVIMVSRMGKSANWATIGSIEVVNGVLQKPRKMFLFASYSPGFQQDMGSLAVAKDGKVLGIQLLRKAPGGGGEEPEILVVVLPAKDVLGVAKQVEM